MVLPFLFRKLHWLFVAYKLNASQPGIPELLFLGSNPPLRVYLCILYTPKQKPLYLQVSLQSSLTPSPLSVPHNIPATEMNCHLSVDILLSIQSCVIHHPFLRMFSKPSSLHRLYQYCLSPVQTAQAWGIQLFSDTLMLPLMVLSLGRETN